MKSQNTIDERIKLSEGMINSLTPNEKYDGLAKRLLSEANQFVNKNTIVKIISEVDIRMKNIEECNKYLKNDLEPSEKSIRSAALLSSLYEEKLKEEGFSPFEILSLTYNNLREFYTTNEIEKISSEMNKYIRVKSNK